MGQSVSTSWLSAPLANELLEELRQYSLQAPSSCWGGPVSGRFRWALNINDWKPRGGADGEEFRLLLSLLRPDEQESIMAYRALQDRKRTLLGRLLALRACAQALGQSDFDGIQISRTKGKKPFLMSPLPKTLPNFNFNVSHDGNWVVLASDSIFLVGADVSAPQQERGEREDETWYQDLQAVLTDAERDNIKSCSSTSSTMRYATFQRIWSAKEAVSKAIGQGLAFGLERMEVQLPGMLQENLGNLVLTALGLSRSEAPEPAAKKGRVKFSSLLENLQNGKTSNGLRHETHAQRTPEVQAQMQRIEIHIDGWPRPDWTVYQEELEGSWISVALGPVDEAVDANGTFRATFRLPGLGGPSDLQALQSKMKMEPMTEATRPWASVSDWTPQAEGFRILPVEALLPQEVTEQLAILRGRDMALAAGV